MRATEENLKAPIDVPQRNYWTFHAASKELNCSRNTIAFYATQICPVIADFREDAKHSKALTTYQFWVIAKVIAYSRQLRADLNGAAYRKDIKAAIYTHKTYLSRARWFYELNNAA